jgi:phosphoserine phosphatase
MATAAAGDYAYCLGRCLGFKHILATPPVRSAAGQENIGERKAEGVMRLIAERGWDASTRVLFTDHIDDLPLARVCHAVYWFGPESERAAAERGAPGVRFAAGSEGAHEIGRAAGIFPVKYQVGA